ncbi:NUDIX hydrolase [Nonomuraea sp. NPDC050227]|uniref:NUDIX hydrolase n=1 Tax=Nonomuraea sp. NPDC050227 TaxID=3364360 RepID=UPI00379422C2
MQVRPSARGVVINEAGEIVLLRCEDKTPVDPRNPHILRYWVTPGGGTKAGETAEESLARELYEEAGLRDIEIGPCIWVRELELLLSRGPVLSHERYFLCRSRQTEFSYDFMTANEKDVIRDIRWWAPAQIATSDETFRPGGFVSLLQRLLVEGPPADPIRIEG